MWAKSDRLKTISPRSSSLNPEQANEQLQLILWSIELELESEQFGITPLLKWEFDSRSGVNFVINADEVAESLPDLSTPELERSSFLGYNGIRPAQIRH